MCNLERTCQRIKHNVTSMTSAIAVLSGRHLTILTWSFRVSVLPGSSMCSLRSVKIGSNRVQIRSTDSRKHCKTSTCKASPVQLEIRGRKIQLTPRRSPLKLVKMSKFSTGSANKSSVPSCSTQKSIDEALRRYAEGACNPAFRCNMEYINEDFHDTNHQEDQQMDCNSSLQDDAIVEKMESITLNNRTKPVIEITPVCSEPDGPNCSYNTGILAEDNNNIDLNFLSVPVALNSFEEFPQHIRLNT